MSNADMKPTVVDLSEDTITNYSSNSVVVEIYPENPLQNQLRSSLLSETQISNLLQNLPRKKQKAIAKFYQRQNLLIENLLDPVTPTNSQEDSTTVHIAIYGSLAANIVLLCLQVYAAVSSSSLSLFATMADSFMDLTSNLVLVFANVTASVRNVYKYPTGKRRFETAGIIVFACIMGALSIELLIEGIKALVGGESVPNLTVLNLSCIGVAVYPIGGMLIAIWILKNWGGTALEHVQKFIGESASPEFLSRLIYIAMTHSPVIKQIDTCRAYSSGAGYFVEIDVVMDAGTLLSIAHDVGESLQVKMEMLEEVERAFVHLDYEVSHKPEHPS